MGNDQKTRKTVYVAVPKKKHLQSAVFEEQDAAIEFVKGNKGYYMEMSTLYLYGHIFSTNNT